MEKLIKLNETGLTKEAVDQVVRNHKYKFDNEMVIGKNNAV